MLYNKKLAEISATFCKKNAIISVYALRISRACKRKHNFITRGEIMFLPEAKKCNRNFLVAEPLPIPKDKRFTISLANFADMLAVLEVEECAEDTFFDTCLHAENARPLSTVGITKTKTEQGEFRACAWFVYADGKNVMCGAFPIPAKIIYAFQGADNPTEKAICERMLETWRTTIDELCETQRLPHFYRDFLLLSETEMGTRKKIDIFLDFLEKNFVTFHESDGEPIAE